MKITQGMKIFLIVVAATTSAVWHSYGQEKSYPLPDFDNVPYYYDEETSTMSNLEKAAFHIENKAKGMYGSVQIIVVPGLASSVRFSNQQKIQFIIHFDDARTEPSILCQLLQFTLNSKNNNKQREYLLESQGLGHAETNNATLGVNFKKVGEGLYLINFPSRPPVGEFGLSIEKTKQGYAFGIDGSSGQGRVTIPEKPHPKDPLGNFIYKEVQKVEEKKAIKRLSEEENYQMGQPPIPAQSSPPPKTPSTTNEVPKQDAKETTQPSADDEIAALSAKLKEAQERKAKEEAAKREAERKAKEEAERIAMERQRRIDSAINAQRKEVEKNQEVAKKDNEAEQKSFDSAVAVGVKAYLANSTIKPETIQRPEAVKAVSKPELPITDNSVIKGIENLYRQYYADSLTVAKMRTEINSEQTSRSVKVSNGEMEEDYDTEKKIRYMGDTQSGRKSGTGVLIDQHKGIWFGTFTNDYFVKGKVIRWYDAERKNMYIGECKSSYPTGNYKENYPSGMGQWTYANGNTELGQFNSQGLMNGIARKTEPNGNRYFGSLQGNKKNGFGIYVTTKGDQYIGKYANDVAQTGYAAQTDDMGLKNYYKITDNGKKPIDPEEWKQFTNEVEKIKAMHW